MLDSAPASPDFMTTVIPLFLLRNVYSKTWQSQCGGEGGPELHNLQIMGFDRCDSG